jgi:hypothetical protein
MDGYHEHCTKNYNYVKNDVIFIGIDTFKLRSFFLLLHYEPELVKNYRIKSITGMYLIISSSSSSSSSSSTVNLKHVNKSYYYKAQILVYLFHGIFV